MDVRDNEPPTSVMLAVVLVDVVLAVLALGGAVMAWVGHSEAAVDTGSDVSTDNALSIVGIAVVLGCVACAVLLHVAANKRAAGYASSDDSS